jgi:hypothetical protein
VKGYEGGYVGIISNDRQSSPAPRKRMFAFFDSELLPPLLLCAGLPAVQLGARTPRRIAPCTGRWVSSRQVPRGNPENDE